MLDPITEKWEDESDLSQFVFSFYCDCCGKKIITLKYKFNSGFKPKVVMTESERKARCLIWQRDHEAAYERANNEATFHFNLCRKCKKRVCQDCFEELDFYCKECAKDNKTEKGDKQ